MFVKISNLNKFNCENKPKAHIDTYNILGYSVSGIEMQRAMVLI